jgi:hypothetical protein
MEDQNPNSEDPAERMRLDPDAFDRLPPAVKLATLLKRENSVSAQAAYVQRRAELAKKTAVIGATILLIPHLPVLGPIGLVLVTVLGATLGYLLVKKDLEQLSGILLFGGGTAAFDLVSFFCDLIPPVGMGYLFLAWIAMISGGMLLAIWAKKQRDKTEMY